MRIAVARFWHEGNSFAPTTVGPAEFAAREWLHGAAVVEAMRGTSTELGGAIAWAESRNDIELVLLRCAAAEPGGPIEQAVVDAWSAEILEDSTIEGVDGIYLSLHGAAIGTESLTPEEDFLERLRVRFPTTPIAASFDMHACPTEAMARTLDVATVYRTYPHIDMDVAAQDALELLVRAIETGERYTVIRRVIGCILPSHNMRTSRGLPMQEIEEIAEASGHPDGTLAAYPFASFAYADTPAADAGVLVTCTDRIAGERIAETVCAAMMERRERFRPEVPNAIKFLAGRPWRDRRIAVVEPSDNPLSGGGADTPGLFAAAVAMLPDIPEGTVFAFFHDPELVDRAYDEGPEAEIETTLGARHTENFGRAVPVRLEVERLTDGQFINAGPMFRGQKMSLGRTALLRCGPMRIIVTSVCVTPNDQNYFALHGIDVGQAPLLLAKAKNHFMAAFAASFDAVVQVDTPGPAQIDTTALPFRHVPPARLFLN